MPYEINTLPYVGTSQANPGFFSIANPDSANVIQRPNVELPNADSYVSTGRFGLDTIAFGTNYNDGTGNWERIRNNTQFTILALAARTATLTSPVQTNYNARGALFFLNISAVAGTSPTLNMQVNTIDPINGSSLSATGVSTNISAAGAWLYGAYPGMSSVFGGAIASGSIVGMVGIPIPRIWNVQINIGGTTPSFTFSLGVMYIL